MLETHQIEEEFKTITSERENQSEVPSFCCRWKSACLSLRQDQLWFGFTQGNNTWRRVGPDRLWTHSTSFCGKSPHSKNVKYPEKCHSWVRFGFHEFSKQLRIKEGLPCPGQVLGVGLDRYQGGKVNLHFYKTTWVRLQFVRSTFLCFWGWFSRRFPLCVLW